MPSEENTIIKLPKDLLSAEHDLSESVLSCLQNNKKTRWMSTLRFQNIRLLPIAIRLLDKLLMNGLDVIILCPDAGGAALAKRDAKKIKTHINAIKLNK